jgi:hypothetical protein
MGWKVRFSNSVVTSTTTTYHSFLTPTPTYSLPTTREPFEHEPPTQMLTNIYLVVLSRITWPSFLKRSALLLLPSKLFLMVFSTYGT